MIYGAAPEDCGLWELDWAEYMRYLYLPVVMRGEEGVRLPERLSFLGPMVDFIVGREGAEDYVYVSAQRAFATPENALNRPGWHADGFGSDDVNYVWADRYPTRFATGDFGPISDDHVVSAGQFDFRARHSDDFDIAVWDGEPNHLYRLDPSVVHATPEVPRPGGERGFIKISVSSNRYNLRGNSHNYLFDYEWRMWTRAEVRNDPAFAGGDVGPQS